MERHGPQLFPRWPVSHIAYLQCIKKIYMNSPKISVLVLNWNGWEDTLECLKSLFQVRYSNFEILITDNGSSNGSATVIAEWVENNGGKNIEFDVYNEGETLRTVKPVPGIIPVSLIKNRENYGFSGGNNRAVKKVANERHPEYVLLLNNDTVVDKDILDNFVEAILSDEKIAAIAPLVNYFGSEPTDTVYCFGGAVNMLTGFVTHFHMGEIKPTLPNLQYVNFLEGSALFIKTDVFIKIGGFDEKFFAYFEDLDLSHRLLKNGYLLACASKAKIWHKVSKSSKVPKKAYYLIRNLIWFMKKDATFAQKIVFFIYLPFRLGYLFFIKSRLNGDYISAVIKGAKEGLFG